MELLQLRRDRVVRADSIIDKNQALILSAPSLLPRLMELLRVMNYNPSLATFGATKKAGFGLYKCGVARGAIADTVLSVRGCCCCAEYHTTLLCGILSPGLARKKIRFL